jgi:hypothetical protein
LEEGKAMHKQLKHGIAGLALAAALTSAAKAAVISGPVVNPANGHIYLLLSPDTWTNSEAEAVSLGGHLVTINDAAENQFLVDTFTSGADERRVLWIGLTDAAGAAPGASEGNFRWTSGEPVTFTRWFAGEPNNSAVGGGPENYTSFNWHFTVTDVVAAHGTWNDHVNSGEPASVVRHGGVPGPYYGVVEIPEPLSLSLLGVAVLPMVLRRRGR